MSLQGSDSGVVFRWPACKVRLEVNGEPQELYVGNGGSATLLGTACMLQVNSRHPTCSRVAWMSGVDIMGAWLRLAVVVWCELQMRGLCIWRSTAVCHAVLPIWLCLLDSPRIGEVGYPHVNVFCTCLCQLPVECGSVLQTAENL
jgi:hypothetical protein